MRLCRILKSLNILFARSKCLKKCRRACNGGERHLKGKEGSRTTRLRHNPEKAIFRCKDNVGKSRNPLQRVVTRCNTDQTGYENCRSSRVRAKAVFGFNRVVTMSPGVPTGSNGCHTVHDCAIITCPLCLFHYKRRTTLNKRASRNT